MSIQALRAILEQEVAGITPAIDTVWENGDSYSPVAGQPYQQVFVNLGDPANPELNGSFFVERGYMQVTLRYPSGKGTKDVEARVQKIRDAFPFGLSISANGITVTVNRTPTRAIGAQDGDRYVVPVKVFFTAQPS